MKLNIKLTVLAALAAGFVTSAQAWNYTASGQWANFQFGIWNVQACEWGSTAYAELYANNAGNFACAGNWSGMGTKNYCNSQANADIPISSGYYYNTSHNFSAPNNPWWCFFYDVWTANNQDELMIQEGWNNSAGGWGSQIASWVSIGGKTIASVWQANNGANNVLIFTPQNQSWSGNENIMAYFIWSLNNGKLHNSTLHGLCFGVEVTYTSGWQQFTVNSFSASWGQNGGGGGGSYHRLQNVATGLYVDGMGRTGNGSDCGQWGNSGSANQNWNIIGNGQIQNQATGLYLDGMGRTGNGSVCGQWSNSGSNAQKWSQQSYNGNYRFQNNQTGLYLDGMYSTGNGSTLCQWSNSGSDGQTFRVQ